MIGTIQHLYLVLRFRNLEFTLILRLKTSNFYRKVVAISEILKNNNNYFEGL